MTSSSAHAWGRRGHAVVCEAAAIVASKDIPFLASSTFDLGYYCNVPDLIWKKGELYQLEWFNHFMDLEIFERAFRSVKVDKPFELNRTEFDKRFPFIKKEAGRSFWRIREFDDRLQELAKKLQDTSLDKAARQRLQLDWLVNAGALGHYIGDLAQPLHVTENFDGELTKQKGVHSFFEDRVVESLYADRALLQDVLKKARTDWDLEQAQLAKKSLAQLMEDLSTDSSRALPALLKIDREVGRQDAKKAANAFRDLVVTRLAKGAVTLAEIWRRVGRWPFNSDQFYLFEGTPTYIAPPKAP